MSPSPRVPKGRITPSQLPGLPWCAEPGNDPNHWDEDTLDPAHVKEARAATSDTAAHLQMRRNRAAELCKPCSPEVRAACLEAGVREIQGAHPDHQWTGGIWGGHIHEDLVVMADRARGNPNPGKQTA